MWIFIKKPRSQLNTILSFPSKVSAYALCWQWVFALCLASLAGCFMSYYRLPPSISVAAKQDNLAFKQLSHRLSVVLLGWRQSQAMHRQLLHQITSAPKGVWLQIAEVDAKQCFLQWVVPPKTPVSLGQWQRVFHVTHLQVDHQMSGDVWRVRGTWS